jgi:tetratricopeptide (TPR) repeat protein
LDTDRAKRPPGRVNGQAVEKDKGETMKKALLLINLFFINPGVFNFRTVVTMVIALSIFTPQMSYARGFFENLGNDILNGLRENLTKGVVDTVTGQMQGQPQEVQQPPPQVQIPQISTGYPYKKATKENTEHAKSLNEACRKAFPQGYQSALNVCVNALNESKSLERIRFFEYIALMNLGDLHRANKNFTEAEKMYQGVYKGDGTQNAPFVANVAGSLGAIYMADKRYGEAETYLEKAVDLFENPKVKLQKNNPGYPITLSLMGDLKRVQNKFEESEKFYKKSIDEFNDRPKKSLPVASTQLRLASLYSTMRKYDLAIELYEKALTSFDEAGVRRAQRDTNMQMSQLLMTLGRYNDAEKRTKVAAALNETLPQKEQAKPAAFKLFLASIYGAAGKTSEYESIANKLLEGVQAEDPVSKSRIYRLFAEMSYEKRKFAAAVDYINKAVSAIDTPEKYVSTYITLLTRQVGILLSQGMVAEADAASKKAVEIANLPEAQYAPTLLLTALETRLSVYKHRDDFDTARIFIQDMMKTAARLKLTNNTDYISTLAKASHLERISGQYTIAEKYLIEAIELAEKPGTPATARISTYASLAYLYINMGKYTESKNYFSKAYALLPETGSKRAGQELRFKSSYGFFLAKIGALDEAIAQLESVIKNDDDAEEIKAEPVLINYAYALTLKGRYPEALKQLDAGTAEILKVFGQANNNKYEADTFKAFYLEQTGKAKEAIALAEPLIGKFAALGIKTSIDSAFAYKVLGAAYVRQNNQKKAIENFEKSIVAYKAISPAHPELSTVYKALAGIYIKQGKKELAATNTKLHDEIAETIGKISSAL